MLLRFGVLIVAIVVSIAIASIVPQVSQTTRAVIGAVPGFAYLSAQQPAAQHAHAEDAGHAEGDDGHGHTQAGKPESKEGVLKLGADRIAAADIKVAKVTEGTLARRLTVPGTIVPAADRIGRVAAKVVGTVAEMKKQLGDSVQEGDVVAVLDSREVADAKSEYLAAGVNFDLQRTLFEREQSLFQKNITAEQQFLRARTTFSEAQLRMDLARQKLAALGVPDKDIAALSRQSTALQRYELRAPIAGRVVERLVNLGAAVGGEGQPKELYGIADLSEVWVELAVPPRDLPSVKEGQAVQVAAVGVNERIDGRIVFKSPILTPETRSARVVAQIPNKDGAWRPGAFVTADIIVEQLTAPIVVPKSALQTVGKEQVVFVRTPDGFEKREVMLGRGDGQAVEIVFGLDAGEDIAVANTFALKAELGKAEASHDH